MTKPTKKSLRLPFLKQELEKAPKLRKQEFTPLDILIDESQSIETLEFLLKEKDRRMAYLENELNYYKGLCLWQEKLKEES